MNDNLLNFKRRQRARRIAKAKRARDAAFDAELYAQLESIDMADIEPLLSERRADDARKSAPQSIADVIEGLTQLATVGVVGATDITEALHREIILRPLGRLNEKNINKWPTGCIGRVYGGVRSLTTFVGDNMTSGMRWYNQLRPANKPVSTRLKRLINVLNGVMGDHLVRLKNPLAISMSLYDYTGQRPKAPLSGRVIILCHGLCMSYLSWENSYGDSLGRYLHDGLEGTTVLYLDYNTGRRISDNGLSLAAELQTLVTKHPDITQIDLVGHSMGGLVARSALFYARLQGDSWAQRVGNLITLGSPHHGASLERIGYYIHDLWARIPFASSFAKLGDLRSAGIIDLRYGSIREADWQSLEGRGILPPEFLHPAQLPLDIYSYFVAGTLMEEHYDARASSFLGDGLVTVASALGEAEDDEHVLFVPESHKAVFYGVSHYNLLYNERIHQQVLLWLKDNGRQVLDDDYALRGRIHSYPEHFELLW
ncbi:MULTISPECIES: alpha/beta fold hydrolase [unclassified Psychrobacter]|uniref:alpha/beta fold hydrolase n=1 Tax=unclassified Psychrobacter TaxID=196806 RepID=UPI0018F4833B|nr:MULTISPECIES: alpha/beta fold hydrolase [unclassified Psychrobacter]